MAKQVVEIKIEKIEKRKELMPRSGISNAVIADYQASLELLPPITVAKNDDGNEKEYVLIDGWHRLEAYDLEGLDSIDAIVVDIEPDDFYFEAAKANARHGRRLSAAEKRKICARLYLQEDRDIKDIAEATGISERHVNRILEGFKKAKESLIEKKVLKAVEKGKSYREIADELPVSKSTVGRIVGKAKLEDKAEPEEVEEEEEEQAEEGEEEDWEDELPDLPEQDLEDPEPIIKSWNAAQDAAREAIKNAKALKYSESTIERMHTVAKNLEDLLTQTNDELLDLII